MRQSLLFTKSKKQVGQDELSKNAQLLIRAGYIHKDMAGVFSFLPLGLRVLNKVVEIIRQEMLSLNAQEVFLSALQDPKVWQASGRWDDKVIDVWFKTHLKNDSEVGLATTHEEALADIMREHITSYRDLPKYVFQFQTKFRNELRAKSGLLRAREFLMKDLYSFTATIEQLDEFYTEVEKAYHRIFQKVGIGEQTYSTFASGGAFSKFSLEFQTVCAAGEDSIHLSTAKKIGINQEVYNERALKELNLQASDLQQVKAIEVGNIFKLGTKFSEALGLRFTDEAGNSQPVVMGSYGIGPGRLMATVAEVHADDQGLVWPASIAPFQIHLVALGAEKDAKVKAQADDVYQQLQKQSTEVLYDDRDLSAGQKFAEADLLGIPTRIVISAKTLASNMIEKKDRQSGQTTNITLAELLAA